jgi:hypothetical protein
MSPYSPSGRVTFGLTPKITGTAIRNSGRGVGEAIGSLSAQPFHGSAAAAINNIFP